MCFITKFVMLTGAQIRAARALLRWSAGTLARESGLSLPTVQRMEATDDVPASHSKNLEAVETALAEAGIIFISENGGGVGVRFKSSSRELD